MREKSSFEAPEMVTFECGELVVETAFTGDNISR
jgi:hypothetical protein